MNSNRSALIFTLFMFMISLATTEAHAKVYGDYNRGCLTESAALPEYGIGYQSTRRSRQMFYAHPETIKAIETLGAKVFTEGLGTVLIGNLSKKNGGPLFEHSISHQNGLDFDVSYFVSKEPLSDVMSQNYEFKSLLGYEKNKLNQKLWDEKIAELLKVTAELPQVERILVDPLIKKQLCETEKQEEWFSKIRPWFKHDNHFHVRLKCPQDSPDCVPQAPPSRDFGCEGPEFEWWFSEEAHLMRLGKLKKPSADKKATPYPEVCQSILPDLKK